MLGAFNPKSTSQRMPNREQLIPRLDWREPHSPFVTPAESPPRSPHSPHSPRRDSVRGFNPKKSPTSEEPVVARPQRGHEDSLTHLDNERNDPQMLLNNQPDSAPRPLGHPALNGPEQAGVGSSQLRDRLLGLAPLGATLHSVSLRLEEPTEQEEGNKHVDMKIGEEEYDEDEDDMLEPDDGSGPPQTEAERRAERRKMKRFRLTHQQTRFLMSEFAKQAHPDSAHRERLSREIPGLSPRQVQVWFQNRRAKIKRLNADDRERMMKMRAVPDDFDNLRALHSPYGAVHGMATPLQSPSDYPPSYGDQAMMRPLVVDTVRRQENSDQHMSPTGISPQFGNSTYTPSASVATPDILSPLSVPASDQFYRSHLSGPLSAGSQGAHLFNRQNSSGSYSMHSQSRNIRPLQPLQLLGTISRSRSHSLQSPLRSSISWKGDSLDYSHYPAETASPNLTGRQQSQYQADQPANTSASAHDYETQTFPNANFHASPTDITYPVSQSNTLRSPGMKVSRYRSLPPVFSPEQSLRTQYDTLQAQQTSSDVENQSNTPRINAFHTSFAVNATEHRSSPLNSPSHFLLQQITTSPPSDPIQDFTGAYNGLLNPVRDGAIERALDGDLTLPQPSEGRMQDRSADGADFLRADHYRLEARQVGNRTYNIPMAFEGT